MRIHKAAKGLEVDHGKAVAAAFKGMTLEQFNEYVQEFKKQAMPSYDGMDRGNGFYLPMLQVVRSMYGLCEEHGWIPFSMKNDWTTIYGDEVTKTR